MTEKEYARREWERCAKLDRMVGWLSAVLLVVLSVLVALGF